MTEATDETWFRYKQLSIKDKGQPVLPPRCARLSAQKIALFRRLKSVKTALWLKRSFVRNWQVEAISKEQSEKMRLSEATGVVRENQSKTFGS
jgi:hypothetical protein